MNLRHLNALKQAENMAQLGYFERNWQTGEGYWSDGFCRLLGREPRTTLSHQEFLNYIHHLDRETVIAHIKNSLETGEPMDVEFRLVHESGDILVIYGIAENSYDTDGRPVLTKGIFQDVTQRKKADQALKESERRYRLLADNTLDVIWRMDLDLSFTYVNPSIKKLTGHTVDEWVGTKLHEHCDEENFNKMAQVVTEELSKGPGSKGTAFEAVLLKKNGDPIPVEIHGESPV